MPSTYTTNTGDTWDLIAYKVWGQETLMHELMAVNPAWRNQVTFPAGVELSIPEITLPVKEEPPPWQER